ncbi:hypothetical protein HY024_01660 [Candidatus Curtissbacteria bacterium]|nr:hypothetical protein [Candidatus Curtissbacteria bacterium]
MYVTWSGDLSGRWPGYGTTTAPFVISGWTPGRTYTAVLHAVNGSTEVISQTSFTTNNCTTPLSISAFTADKNYYGYDQAGAYSNNGCLTNGNQKGSGAVRFTWTVSGTNNVYVTWSGNLSGRWPGYGTTTAPFVISGWTRNSYYTATLHAVGPTGQEVTRVTSFVINNCF